MSRIHDTDEEESIEDAWASGTKEEFVSWLREDSERTQKADERVYVDRQQDAPDDKVVHAELNEDGDTEALYYEK